MDTFQRYAHITDIALTHKTINWAYLVAQTNTCSTTIIIINYNDWIHNTLNPLEQLDVSSIITVPPLPYNTHPPQPSHITTTPNSPSLSPYYSSHITITKQTYPPSSIYYLPTILQHSTTYPNTYKSHMHNIINRNPKAWHNITPLNHFPPPLPPSSLNTTIHSPPTIDHQYPLTIISLIIVILHRWFIYPSWQRWHRKHGWVKDQQCSTLYTYSN